LFLLPRERDESIYFCIPTICYATPLKISRTLPRVLGTRRGDPCFREVFTHRVSVFNARRYYATLATAI